MQTQHPRCVPRDCGVKQTPLRDQTNLTPRSGIDSDTICGQYLYGWERAITNGIRANPQPWCEVCLVP